MHVERQTLAKAPVQERPLWLQYTLAIGLAAVAVAARFALDPIVGDRVPFLTLFIVLLPLVMLVRGGPFLAGAIVGLSGVLFLFVQPRGSPDFHEPRVGVQVGLFLVAVIAAAVTAWLSRRQQDRIRRADLSIRAHLEELDALYAAAPVGLCFVDRSFRYARINKELADINGVPVEAHIGKSPHEVVPDIAGDAERVFRSVLNTKQTVQFELRGSTPGDANRVWYEQWYPVLDESGEVQGVGVIVNDITERKAAEAEIRAHRDNLQQLVEQRTAQAIKAHQHAALAQRMAAVGTLAAGLAHDMKNLLLPMGARMDALLAMPTLPQAARSELAVVTALLDHLRSMAKNLSLFAQDPDHESGEEWTDLAQWLLRVKGFIDASAGPGIIIKWSVPQGLPRIPVAPHRVTQAVQNLVHNARDAIKSAKDPADRAGQPGLITVAASLDNERPDRVLLKVIDNGCGMSEEVRSHCIEPFFTTKDRPAISGAEGGTGLGLSIAYSVVERAGGELRIDSKVGGGTTVTLALPAAPRAASTASVRRAHVTIEDKRLRAVTVELLRQAEFDIEHGPPGEGAATGLWITDRDSAVPEKAAEFLRRGPGHRVVVVGGDEGWRSVGARVCDAGVASLRSAVAEGLK